MINNIPEDLLIIDLAGDPDYSSEDTSNNIRNFIASKLHIPAPHSIPFSEEIITPNWWSEQDSKDQFSDISENHKQREQINRSNNLNTNPEVRLSILTLSSSELPQHIRNRLIGGDNNNTTYCITNLDEAVNVSQQQVNQLESNSKPKRKLSRTKETPEQQFLHHYFTNTITSTFTSSENLISLLK